MAAAGAPVRFASWRPGPALRPYVAYATGYAFDGTAPSVHRGLPSPYLTLVITLDEPLEVLAHPDPAQPAGRYDALLGGLHERPAYIVQPTRQSGIQLAVTPLGARALLGLPAGALASLDVDLADVLGAAPAARLRQRLQEQYTWAGRARVLESALTDAVRPDVQLPAAVSEAWRVLLATGGAVPVGALATHVGYSPRRLGTLFGTEIGLRPKAAGRVLRFTRSRAVLEQRLRAGVAPGLGAVAAACGYYDQSHLDREWRAIAGCPPSAWLVEEFRSVQARGDLAGQDSQP